MKAISILGLFILLATGAASQPPVTFTENPHQAAHQQAHQQAMQAHQQAHQQAMQAHEQAHNQALDTHHKANEQAMDHDQSKKQARKRLLTRSGDSDKSGFLARWKERRTERAAAKESSRQKQQ